MTREDLALMIAPAFTKGLKREVMRQAVKSGLSNEEFFTLPTAEIALRLGANVQAIPRSSNRKEALAKAFQETDFIVRNHIRAYIRDCEDYPDRLNKCADAPSVLFVIGNANLNPTNIISIVGTRRCTGQGMEFVKKCVADMKTKGVCPTIVSGLAYGIDTSAHEAALRNGLPTIAVVAHGLDTIYPPENRQLAREIIRAGGAIVTEYPINSRPYRQCFLERNRIIAGLSDLTLIVESEIKGGAMSTARLALDYNRDVAALPGRYNDEKSSGCNWLISHQQASLITSADDIMRLQNWQTNGDNKSNQLESLFSEPEGDSKLLYDLLASSTSPMTLDDLNSTLKLSVGTLLSILGELEMDGLIHKLPGNKYMKA